MLDTLKSKNRWESMHRESDAFMSYFYLIDSQHRNQLSHLRIQVGIFERRIRLVFILIAL